jgi:hypothetical protein
MMRWVMAPNGSSVVKYVHVAPRWRGGHAFLSGPGEPRFDFRLDRCFQLAEHRVHL